MRILNISALVLIALCGSLVAQPFEPGPGMDSNDAGGLPPTQRWMERMQHHHPEDYPRMEQLRKENPAAFRGMLRERVDTKHVENVMREYPPLNNAYQSLPPDKRLSFVEKLYDRPHGPRDGPDFNRTRGPKNEKSASEIQQLDAEIMTLGELYRNEKDSEKKKDIKENLDAKLHELANTMDRHRAEKIVQMGKKLEELKQSLSERQKTREDILSRHLERLTGQD